MNYRKNLFIDFFYSLDKCRLSRRICAFILVV